MLVVCHVIELTGGAITQVLENRTKASRQEMDMLETLQDLKELNSRHARLNQDQVIELHQSYEKQLLKLQEDEDEAFVQ